MRRYRTLVDRSRLEKTDPDLETTFMLSSRVQSSIECCDDDFVRQIYVPVAAGSSDTDTSE